MRAIRLTDAQHRAMTESKAKLAHRKPIKPKVEPVYVGIVRAFCERRGFPAPVAEYAFLPLRRFRFDLAWPALMVSVELEGGIWTGGGHVRGKKFESNCEKYSEAAIRGWMLVRMTPEQLSRGKGLEWIERALTAAMGGGAA